MSRARPTVVFGLVGSTLDSGGQPGRTGGHTRWKRWRPTVDLVRHKELPITRFELLHQREHAALAKVVADDIRALSHDTEVRLVPVTMRDPWDFEEVYAALYDVIARYPFDTEHEDYLVHITTGTHVAQICWFLLAESRRIPARLVQASPPKTRGDEGARDEKLPRKGTLSIIDLDLSRYDDIRRRFVTETKESIALLKAGIETKSPLYNTLIDELSQVATSSHAPLLLLGETGTGKTALARRVYELKKARQKVKGAFVEVNCATLRGDHAMSTLFGHKKGAFTGAHTDREGLLLRAHQGVLFLDEVGELGLDEQAMLLRAIEEKHFLPLGGDREVSSSFQLLCGTHRDLSVRVREGRFREDLLARLDVWRFTLPPLRARREDIAPNIDVELRRASEMRGLQMVLTGDARTELLTFARAKDTLWPGNFRDLSAFIERLSTLSTNGRIESDDVKREIARARRVWRIESEGEMSDTSDDTLLEDALGPRAAALDPFDRHQLAYVLRVCRESRSLADAGRALFSVSRLERSTTNDSDRVRKYLAKFGLAAQGLQFRQR
jgi:transcriptional regulatory protein RtcR